MDFIEIVMWKRMGMVDLRIKKKKEMGDLEGLNDKKGKLIIIREEVYEKEWKDSNRERFKVEKELGKFFIKNGIKMESEREERRIKEYRMSEKKENKLEGEILMNRKLK